MGGTVNEWSTRPTKPCGQGEASGLGQCDTAPRRRNGLGGPYESADQACEALARQGETIDWVRFTPGPSTAACARAPGLPYGYGLVGALFSCVAALLNTLPMLFRNTSRMAISPTATSAMIKAYSTRPWPDSSAQNDS